MSDYGFTTYDDSTRKKRLGTVNSKWPIFGPLYSDIRNAYRTVHLIDTYEPDFKTAEFDKNADSGELVKRWHEKQLVHQFEHGYNFRPVGYAFFSGEINVDEKFMIQQTTVNYSWPSYTLYGSYSGSSPILPDMSSQMKLSRVGTGYDPISVVPGQYGFTITSTTPSPSPMRAIFVVPNDTLGGAKKHYIIANSSTGARWPYEVEIDDKYVRIYRNVYWLDDLIWLSPPGMYIETRVKGVAYFAGTGVDCTIYLCPYSLGDMLPRKHIPNIEPSNIGI